MTPRTTNTPRRSSVAAMNTAIKWGATFPEQFETDEDSFKFVSRCLLLGVAQVLKMRRLLPPEDFRKRNVTEICQCTTFHSETATGRRCSKKLNGAAEAIKLSYLKEFIIVVSTNETNHDDAIEVFTWSFAYNRGQAVVTLSKPDGEALTTLKYNGPETVKEETIAMLLKIRRLCSRILGPLPDTAFATFRVTYYQNKPSGYQAPGFHLSETVYDLDSRAKRLGLGGTAVAGSKLFVSVQSVCLEDPDEATRQLDRANMTSLTLDDSRIEYAFAYDMGAPVAPSSIRAADPGVLTSKPDVSFASPNLKGHMRALSLQKSPGNCTRLDQMSPEK